MAVEPFGGARTLLRHPSQYIAVTFLAAIAIGTLLLRLPAASQRPGSTSWLTALFTSASASCVTGLTVVDTESHWSGFGQWVILGLIQVGGLGIMTLSSLIILTLSRRLGLRQRIVAASATGAVAPGDVRYLLGAVIRLAFIGEAIVAVCLFLRFWLTHDFPLGRAAYLGVFHAVSALNNAGFVLFPDSFVGFQTDSVLLLVTGLAVVVGGLGFPVWVQLSRHRHRVRRWDLHTKMTMATTAFLIIAGWIAFIGLEWSNPDTIGPLSAWDSAVNSLFQSVSFRTAGISSMHIGDVEAPTQLLTEVLMFIGGGSASTAGGIKVTTFALMGFVMWAELRGEPDVVVFKRRVPVAAQRQGLTVALMAVGGVIASTMLLLSTSGLNRSDLLFETVSALGSVGLSTGITPQLSAGAQVVVIALMYLGRVGPPTLFAALVLRERDRLYRRPEERPIVG